MTPEKEFDRKSVLNEVETSIKNTNDNIIETLDEIEIETDNEQEERVKIDELVKSLEEENDDEKFSRQLALVIQALEKRPQQRQRRFEITQLSEQGDIIEDSFLNEETLFYRARMQVRNIVNSRQFFLATSIANRILHITNIMWLIQYAIEKYNEITNDNAFDPYVVHHLFDEAFNVS